MVSGGDIAGGDAARRAGGDSVIGFQIGTGGGDGQPAAGPTGIGRGGIRGRLLRLGPAADSILARHGYPDDVSRLLGEALGVAALLAETLKFDGVFTLQARGEGPVPLLVADYRKPGQLRGHASLNQERYDRLQAGPSPSEPVPRLLGGGLLSFTVDQGGHAQRYQGIVELRGGTLADCTNAYFQQSEQLDTVLRLAAGRVPGTGEGPEGGWRVGGILLQRLPDAARGSDEEDDAWPRAMALLGSARDEELLDPELSAEALLFRLFHEDGVRVFEPQQLEARCTCSRDRILEVLRTFSAGERAEMVVDDHITVTCQFCNRNYDLRPEEIGLGAEIGQGGDTAGGTGGTGGPDGAPQ